MWTIAWGVAWGLVVMVPLVIILIIILIFGALMLFSALGWIEIAILEWLWNNAGHAMS